MRPLAFPDGRFCLQWMGATTIAIVLSYLFGPIGLFMGPAVLALAQGFVLRRYWSQYLVWGIVTMLTGYGAIALLFLWVLALSSVPLPLVLFLGGALIGLGQAMVFRQGGRSWVWWPGASGLALMVSLFWFMPGVVNAAIYGSRGPLWQGLALAGLTGLLGGSIKGVLLNWVLRSPPRT